MKKIFLFLLCAGSPFFLSAQKGTFNVSGTLAPGFLLGQHQVAINFHGFLEYFPEDKLSFHGDNFFYLGTNGTNGLFKGQISTTFGIAYHYLKNDLDLFVGFQPGIAYTSMTSFNDSALIQYSNDAAEKISPLISANVGFTYHIGRFFNFFGRLMFVQGQFVSPQATFSLNELRISAGLGFNLGRKK